MRCGIASLLVFVLVASSPGSTPPPPPITEPIDALLGDSGLPSAPDRDTFMGEWSRLGFQWLSDLRDRAHAYKQPHTVFGQPVAETVATFTDGKLTALAFTTYARGDDGSISEKEFGDRIRALREAISAWAGAKPRLVDDQIQARGVKRAAEAWSRGPLDIRMICSWSTRVSEAIRFQAEYIRLEVSPRKAQAPAVVVPTLSRPQRGREVSLADLQKSITREANGDVWIRGIPMIDQGEKGYCAVASVARVLQFYGIPSDQHEIAQLARSDSEFGTNPDQMIDVLKRVGAKLGCRVRIYEEYDWREFERFLQRYNSLAKRRDLPQIDPMRWPTLDGIYRAMDADVMREARLKEQGDYSRFRREIADAIAEGIPLAWGVTTGLIREDPPVLSIGGHMRLIIGYNERDDRVIYSDTWGAGHEKKSMPFADAWAITHGLYAIEPRNTR